jgi:hypothetical protein
MQGEVGEVGARSADATFFRGRDTLSFFKIYPKLVTGLQVLHQLDLHQRTTMKLHFLPPCKFS